VLFAIGGLTHEHTVRSMDLFGAQVMPALRADQPTAATAG